MWPAVKRYVVGVFMVMDRRWLKFVVRRLCMQRRENKIRSDESARVIHHRSCFVLGGIFRSKNLWGNTKCSIVRESKCTGWWDYSSNDATICIRCNQWRWCGRGTSYYNFAFSFRRNKPTAEKTLELNYNFQLCISVFLLLLSKISFCNLFFLSIVLSQLLLICVFYLFFLSSVGLRESVPG